MTSQSVVELAPGHEGPAGQTYVVFSGGIRSQHGDLPAGDVARVVDTPGDYVATGWFKRHSEIRVRLSRSDDGPLEPRARRIVLPRPIPPVSATCADTEYLKCLICHGHEAGPSRQLGSLNPSASASRSPKLAPKRIIHPEFRTTSAPMSIAPLKSTASPSPEMKSSATWPPA